MSRLLKVLKPVNAVLLILVILSFLSYGICVLVIDPLPKVDNDNIIRDFKPMFGNVFGLYTDNSGNFYVHTTECIMRFDSEWNYQYSYVYRSSEKSAQALVVTEDGLLIGYRYGKGETALISFTGKILYVRFDLEPRTVNTNHNKSVFGANGKRYELRMVFSSPLFQQVVDDSGIIVWHTSYIGGILDFAVWILSGLTLFLFVFRKCAEDYRNVPIIKICIKLKSIILRKNDNTELTEDDSS